MQIFRWEIVETKLIYNMNIYWIFMQFAFEKILPKQFHIIISYFNILNLPLRMSNDIDQSSIFIDVFEENIFFKCHNVSDEQ